jgi:hypothetical protein
VSYLSHSLQGEELVLDSGTLWRAACALRDASELAPMTNYQELLLQHPAIQPLKESEILRDKLIQTVEAEQRLGIVCGELSLLRWYHRARKRELRAQIAPLAAERDRVWREYEMLRKLSVRDGNRTLMLHRVHAVSAPAP